MANYYRNYNRNRKKEIIRNIIYSDDKMYKAGAALAHIYSALGALKILGGGGK